MPLDSPPPGSPLSTEYKRWVEDLAKAVNQLMQKQPLYEFGIHDTQGGSPHRDDFFPAFVTYNKGGSWPNNNIICGEPDAYSFGEIFAPFPRGSSVGGRSGTATNLMEWGLCNDSDCDAAEGNPSLCGDADYPGSTGDYYIPPGITRECLKTCDDREPETDFCVDVFPIGHPNGAIVNMFEYQVKRRVIWGGTTREPGYKIYYFMCPVATCARCVRKVNP